MKKPGTSIHRDKEQFFVMAKQRGFFFLMLLLAFSVAVVSLVRADVPPPPVNQLLGIPDTRFENPTESDCRECHASGLPDRHHLLVGTPIPPDSPAPYPDADGDGVPDAVYDCLNCHSDNPDTPVIDFLVVRDCLYCHIYIPDSRPSTPHHITQDALERHCSVCHGSLVQDFDDDHYIPDYDISDVTPDPVCKTWDGPICVSGGCFVCHTDDTAAVPPIARYNILHHATRFDCSFCHDIHGNIRACETCHSPDSLHNIQADSDNPENLGTIIPGEENLGWGHIGNGWDCFGCHESFMNGTPSAASGAVATSRVFMNSVTPQTGATIPTISGLSTRSVSAGQDTEVRIYGNGFINSTDGITLFTPDVVLERGTMTVTLGQTFLTEGEITVIVPSMLSPGLYDLRVIKDDKKSNKETIALVPPVVIDSARLRKGSLTLTGSGFSQYPFGYASDLGVTITQKGVQHECDIFSWTDTEITAQCDARCGTGVVTTIFGVGSFEISCGKRDKPPKPCKGKNCS